MIYFDNSATTLPFPEVVNSFVKVSTEYFGNPSSLHGIGAMAERLLSQARNQIAELLEVKEREIFFTSGGTEGNNLAIKGVALAHQNRGKHIIISSIEHPSVKLACEQLQTMGFEVTYLNVDKFGRVSVDELEKSLRQDTILVSVMHVNNETGTIQPIVEIGNRLKNYPKVLFHVDNVQGVGKVDLNIKGSHIDLCTFSAHKFHGLKGNGFLYVREGVPISPLLSGGNQEMKLRSGTENVAGAVSTARALRMIKQEMETGKTHIDEIKQYLRSNLETIEGVVINTSIQFSAPHILNFSLPGMKSEVVIHDLEEKGIYVSTTSACSSKKKTISQTVLAMTNDETLAGSTVRISLSYQNNLEEAKAFIETFIHTIKQLKQVMRS
ncbi:cysteine desulfurase family protein [Peribacillus alkalitolerans]|uniref:cysteine desulfurase family protein n=1 Tax=Peribacillus alkalitolerans TaxID=1550385 RepID=UPI0013D62D2C|nr:cysteine desulfurase family protein [Peribacillus alkalitolerans]